VKELVKETGKKPDEDIQSSKAWWASQRHKYNKGLVIAGISAFILYVGLGSVLTASYDDFEITAVTIFVQGIGYLFMMAVANLFYNSGHTVEQVFNKTNDIKFRKRLFNLGYWFSCALPFLVILTIIAGYQPANEHLTGNYYLVEMETGEGLMLGYDLGNGNYVGVVPQTLFAVGYNDEYIIAGQHPCNGYGPGSVNKKVTYYYIVPLKYKVHDWPDENRIGPLPEEEFLAKRKELNMPDSLTFTKIFKKQE
jgi:hypothetical protein